MSTFRGSRQISKKITTTHIYESQFIANRHLAYDQFIDAVGHRLPHTLVETVQHATVDAAIQFLVDQFEDLSCFACLNMPVANDVVPPRLMAAPRPLAASGRTAHRATAGGRAAAR